MDVWTQKISAFDLDLARSLAESRYPSSVKMLKLEWAHADDCENFRHTLGYKFPV